MAGEDTPLLGPTTIAPQNTTSLLPSSSMTTSLGSLSQREGGIKLLQSADASIQEEEVFILKSAASVMANNGHDLPEAVLSGIDVVVRAVLMIKSSLDTALELSTDNSACKLSPIVLLPDVLPISAFLSTLTVTVLDGMSEAAFLVHCGPTPTPFHISLKQLSGINLYSEFTSSPIRVTTNPGDLGPKPPKPVKYKPPPVPAPKVVGWGPVPSSATPVPAPTKTPLPPKLVKQQGPDLVKQEVARKTVVQVHNMLRNLRVNKTRFGLVRASPSPAPVQRLVV